MGYTTDFHGSFTITPALTAAHLAELNNFTEERHEESENFPSYYCQWRGSEDGTELEWDQGEKFYSYVEWVSYLIDHFFKPNGYTLEGEVRWQGEDTDDSGMIIVKANRVGTAPLVPGEITWVDEPEPVTEVQP